jgi:hypothetical protein
MALRLGVDVRPPLEARDDVVDDGGAAGMMVIERTPGGQSCLLLLRVEKWSRRFRSARVGVLTD